MANVTVKDLITTYQVPFTDGSIAFWDENDQLETFQILQFHVHAPSEHTFDGKNYDLEVHFVHKSYTENKLAVLAVFFDTKAGGDKTNEFIASLQLDKSNIVVPEIPAMKLIRGLDTNKLYHYQGSLTTPPCSEIVTWIVTNDPQPISKAQVDLFNNKWMKNYTFARGHGNNRNI